MDAETCTKEQLSLRNAIGTGGRDLWLTAQRVLSSRYLTNDRVNSLTLINNYPKALANIISYAMTYSGNTGPFAEGLRDLFTEFERSETCRLQ